MEEPQIKTINVSEEPSTIEPKKKKRRGGKFLFFLILLVGLGAFFFFKYQESQPATAIKSSLKLLKENNVKEDYQETSVGFKEETSLETFTLFVKQNPSLTKNKTLSFPSKKSEKNSITLKGTLTSEDGTVIPIKYKLVKQDGIWRIEGIEIDSTK